MAWDTPFCTFWGHLSRWHDGAGWVIAGTSSQPFASGGSVASGPAIVGSSVYWGSGYSKSGIGSPSRRLYAFSVAG